MVLVQWEDSASATRNWVGKDESMGTVMCASVGFLHKRKRTSIVLAQSTAEMQVGHLLAIPTSAIRSMSTLTRGVPVKP